MNNLCQEENMTNGSMEAIEPQVKEDESDGLVAKSRRKAPWVNVYCLIIVFISRFLI